MRLFALLLALFSVPALATNPIVNVAVVPGGDGNLYSRFIDGSVIPPPPYVALDIDLGTSLATAGIGAIPCGTTGNDFSFDVRTSYITGTNAATAAITINQVSGDNFDTEGATPPGSGSNLVFECANPTVSKSGVFTLTVADGTSSDTTTNKSWATVAVGGNPVADHSNTIIQLGFESGAVTARDTMQSGVSVDAATVQTLPKRTTFTVDSITQAAHAKLHWTGTDPSLTNANINGANSTAGFAGFTLGNVSGMNELDYQMVRCDPATINNSDNSPTTGGSCEILRDGGANNVSDGDACLGGDNSGTNNACVVNGYINSTGYGAFTGSVTANTWQFVATSGASSLTDQTADLKVVTSVTPPDNLVGSANDFFPREGNFFFSGSIGKNRDYAAFNGNGAKVKPRYTFLLNNDSGGLTDIPYDSEFCLGASIALPSNYDHNDQSDRNSTEDQYIRIAQSAAQDEAIFTISITGNASGIDHWTLIWNDQQGDVGKNTVDLGAVTNSINHWQDFLLKGKINASNGYYEVWGRQTDRFGLNPTSWALMAPKRGPGVPVGYNPGGDFRLGIRQYKYGWTDHANTTPSYDIWQGWDSVYLTRFGIDGGTCAKVTADGSNPSP